MRIPRAPAWGCWGTWGLCLCLKKGWILAALNHAQLQSLRAQCCAEVLLPESRQNKLTSSSKIRKQKESLTYLNRLNGNKNNCRVVLTVVRAWNEGIKEAEGFPSSQR